MMCWSVGVKSMLVGFAIMASTSAGPTSTSITPDDPRIGMWDGKTASAVLKGPYEDRTQAEIPFGRRSFYLTPWRAYMDTWPASRLLESSGINFNVDANEADATAEMIAEAGIRSARIEIGWGSFRYDDPTKLPEDTAKRLTAILSALKKHNVRTTHTVERELGRAVPFENFARAHYPQLRSRFNQHHHIRSRYRIYCSWLHRP